MKCFLSGLEIPNGQYSIEHIVPRFWLPSRLSSMRENKAPAIKVINNIKSIKMPCEWFDMRYDLAYHAYKYWHLRKGERPILEEAIEAFREDTDINPCARCILSKTATCYCRERPELEKYRQRWLYEIKQR